MEDENEFFDSFVKMNFEYGINIFGTDLERPYGISKLKDTDLDFSKSDQYIEEWQDLGLNALYIPGTDSFHVETYGERTFLKYLDQIVEHYEGKDWLDISYVYPIDEPETKNAYERVRELYGKIKYQNPNLRKVISEQVTSDAKKWGDLRGYIDTWLVNGELYYSDLDSLKAQKKEGDESGFYTQGRYSGKYGYKTLEVPTHAIDRAFNDLLWVGLLAFKNADEFHMFWNTTYWAENDPWKDPQTYKAGNRTDKTTNMGNGAGYLYYPGTKLNKYVSGQDSRPESVVPSLRLMALEEGLNLYEVANLVGFPKRFIPEFSELSFENAETLYLNLIEQLYSNFYIEGDGISFQQTHEPSFWQNLKELFS